MFTWIIAFIVIGAIVGCFMKENKSGAVEGAATGFAAIYGIILWIVLPLLVIIFLFKSCTG